MTVDEFPSFGPWLKQSRKTRDLTQAQLALRVACASSTIRKFEAGERRPSKELAVRLAEELAIPEDERAAFLRSARARGHAALAASSRPKDARAADVLTSSIAQRVLDRRATSVDLRSTASNHGRAARGGDVVTLLMTDIAKSGELWEVAPDLMGAALARYDALLADCMAGRGDMLAGAWGLGDGRVIVFSRPTEALAAAAALQRRLHEEPWPTPVPLQVRMAVHSGEVDGRAPGYSGPAIARAAMLRTIARGGQILVSQTAADLASGHLPAGITLLDLGVQRLTDLSVPERIFQVRAAGIRHDFPPIATVAPPPSTPGRLPRRHGSLIGRSHDVAIVRALLLRPEVSLLTLTGTAGTGKTRLAVHAAGEMASDFPDGVFFVDLASISDPVQLPAAIAQVVGAREAVGRDQLESLKDELREKKLLLLLDNFEQVLAGAPIVADLLEHCSRPKILVTSRIPLHLRDEHQFLVTPLALPDRRIATPIDRLGQYPAVALFAERARAVRPDFEITDSNAAALAEICIRLDGLPLAIELAAAWTKYLAPQALLARLEHRLALLSGGPRDLPARHQTLRAAIDWSFSLLDDHERSLFARLAVFAGSFSPDAAQAVCNAERDLRLGVFEGLVALADKNLLWHGEDVHGEPRFRMLQTIREYALDHLDSGGQPSMNGDATRRAHAAYYLELAQQAEPALATAAQGTWLSRLDIEHDNLSAALSWCLDGSSGAASPRAGSDADLETAARLAGALWSFWRIRGYMSEGRRWLDEIIERRQRLPAQIQANVLGSAGSLAQEQYDYRKANAFLEESLKLFQRLGDKRAVAATLSALGRLAPELGAYGRAERLLTESLELFQELGDSRGIAWTLAFLGQFRIDRGDPKRAEAVLIESLAIFGEIGDTYGLAWPRAQLGRALHFQGDYQRAAALLGESLTLFEGLGDKRAVAFVRMLLGWVQLDANDIDGAQSAIEMGLALFRAQGEKAGIGWSLLHLGQITALRGDPGRAEALLSESLAIFREIGHRIGAARSLAQIGDLAAEHGSPPQAMRLLREGLLLSHQSGDQVTLVSCLESIAAGARNQGQAERATRLYGAAAAVREQIGVPLPAVARARHDWHMGAARAELKHTEFETAWKAGRAMPLEQAVAYAMADLPGFDTPDEATQRSSATATRASASTKYPAGLTDREVEILRLVTEGLTYSQIAARLIISPHTVNAHLRTIYGKLEVTSRSAATRFAVEHHLV